MGRIGTPEDIAYSAAHLISSQAEFITGAVVAVDGRATGVSHMDRQVSDMPKIPPTTAVDIDAAERLKAAGRN